MRRSVSRFLLLWVVFSVVPVLTAEEFETKEILARVRQALGAEAWDAVHSLEMSCHYSSFSQRYPCTLYQSRPDRYRFDHTFNDAEMVLGFDGELGWWLNKTSFSVIDWAEEAPPAQLSAIMAEADFGGPFIEAKGHQARYAGLGDLDGQSVHIIEIRRASGGEETWYLDPESFLPLARIYTGAFLQIPMEQTSYFSDYRPVGGISFPHRVEIEQGPNFYELEVEAVSINPKLDPLLFAMPIPSGMTSLRGLAGEWNVHVRGRSASDRPWDEATVVSKIAASQHDALLTEELEYPDQTHVRRLRRVLTYDRFQDVFRLARFDAMTSHLDILEGRLVDGRLITTNLETGTVWELRGQTFHGRETVYDMSADGFKVDWEVSSDGGETWTLMRQFVYSRSSS